MCAYNAVDGRPAARAPTLLQEHLRDGLALRRIRRLRLRCGRRRPPQITSSPPDFAHASAVAAVKAGTDLDLRHRVQPSPPCRTRSSRACIGEAEIDRAVKRLFTARFRLGMFDPPELVRLRANPDHGERLDRAPEAGPTRRARGDRPAQERGRSAAPGPLGAQDRRRRPHGRRAVALPATTTARRPIRSRRSPGSSAEFKELACGTPWARILHSPHGTRSCPCDLSDRAPHGRRPRKAWRGVLRAVPTAAASPSRSASIARVNFNGTRPPRGHRRRRRKSFSVRWTGSSTPAGPGRLQARPPRRPCYACDSHEQSRSTSTRS